MNLIKSIVVYLFYSVIIGQSQYQILTLSDNIFQLSSNNGFSALTNHNSTSNPAALKIDKGQTYTLLYYPSDIKLANFRINNFSLSILNYGTLVDELDNVINKKFTANDYLFKYYYNQQFNNGVRFGFSIGTYYSQIYNYNSYGVVSSIGINKYFSNINLGLGFSIENIGLVIKNYTNTQIELPSRLTCNIIYQFKKMKLGYQYVDFVYDQNIEHILSLSFEISKYVFLNFGTSSYRNNLALDTDYKYLYGMSCGLGFRINNHEINLGIKNLGIAGNIYGITINNLIN